MPKSLTIVVFLFFGLGLAILPQITPADPPPPALHQITIGPKDLLGPEVPAPPGPANQDPEADDNHWWQIPLNNITSKLFLSELDQAFVPNVGSIVLRPGESVRYPFRLQYIRAIVPGPTDHVLLICGAPDGFMNVVEIVRFFDTPATRSTKLYHTMHGAKTGILLEQSSQTPPARLEPPDGKQTITESFHYFRIPLHHMTPLAVLDHIRQAYVPDDGIQILKPGETLRSSFRMDGVQIIFPNTRDNSLLVSATPDGFYFVHDLIKMLDVPKTSVLRNDSTPETVPSPVVVP